MNRYQRLAILGGANPETLERVPTAIGQYVGMGLVLLSTALMATVSMWFGLVEGVRIHPLPAIPIAIVWGLIILNLDRFLVSNMHRTSALWQTLIMALPRLCMAALIGIVISTPLVLKIFESDIEAQMQIHNSAQSAENQKLIQSTSEQQRVDQLQAELESLRKIQAGNLGETTNTAVQVNESRIAELEASVAKQTEVRDEAQKLYICERYGTGRESLKDPSKCSPTPGIYGPFPQIEADFNRQESLLQDLEKQLQDARGSLTQNVSEAASQQQSALRDAQEQADQRIPTVQSELAAANTALNSRQQQLAQATANDEGILAQLRGLNTLSHENPLMGAAHWAIAALFFMVEVLPVIVKLMLNGGPPSLYERVQAMEQDSLYDDATAKRNDERYRIEASSKMRREIDDDMRIRQKDINIKANQHVASEMQTILASSLQQWSREVAETLANSSRESQPPRDTSQGVPLEAHKSSTDLHTLDSKLKDSSRSAGATGLKMHSAILKKFNLPSRNSL